MACCNKNATRRVKTKMAGNSPVRSNMLYYGASGGYYWANGNVYTGTYPSVCPGGCLRLVGNTYQCSSLPANYETTPYCPYS